MTVDEKVAADLSQGGSPAGYSFYKKYMTCPRRFALEELLGVNTRQTKWALEQGRLLHGAMEVLYMGWPQAQVDQYIAKMAQKALPTDEERDKMYFRVRQYVWAYAAQWLEHDLENYDQFELEKPITVPLMGGLSMTGRIDKLYRSKSTGTKIIGDYKTTGSGLKTASRQAEQGDQFTLYTHAMKQLEPDNRFQVVLDLLYGRELKSTGFTVSLQREAPVVYTRDQLLQSVMGMTAVVVEVSQKVKSFLAGDMPLEFLFPRNGTVCGIYGCPYSTFCRRQITPGHLEGADVTFDREKVTDLKDFRQFEITAKEINNEQN